MTHELRIILKLLINLSDFELYYCDGLYSYEKCVRVVHTKVVLDCSNKLRKFSTGFLRLKKVDVIYLKNSNIHTGLSSLLLNMHTFLVVTYLLESR